MWALTWSWRITSAFQLLSRSFDSILSILGQSYAEGLEGFPSLIAFPDGEGICMDDEILRTLFIRIPESEKARSTSAQPVWCGNYSAMCLCLQGPGIRAQNAMSKKDKDRTIVRSASSCYIYVT